MSEAEEASPEVTSVTFRFSETEGITFGMSAKGLQPYLLLEIEDLKEDGSLVLGLEVGGGIPLHPFGSVFDLFDLAHASLKENLPQIEEQITLSAAESDTDG